MYHQQISFPWCTSLLLVKASSNTELDVVAEQAPFKTNCYSPLCSFPLWSHNHSLSTYVSVFMTHFMSSSINFSDMLTMKLYSSSFNSSGSLFLIDPYICAAYLQHHLWKLWLYSFSALLQLRSAWWKQSRNTENNSDLK